MHSPNTLHVLFVLAAIVVVAAAAPPTKPGRRGPDPRPPAASGSDRTLMTNPLSAGGEQNSAGSAAPAGSEIGACCVFSESCLDDVDPGTCAEVYGGTYQGDGSTCTDAHDCPSATGACCFDWRFEGWCEEGTAFECAFFGGVYQGDESTCETVDCPTGLCPGHGDCCTPNRSPGCENEVCCGIVCELDPYCCTQAWDSICAAAADEFCGCGNVKGDIDEDGNVDLQDYAWWPECMTGPDHGPYDAPCIAFDFDKDGDVDLRDFGAFQRAFGGPVCGDGSEDPGEECDHGGESATCDPDCTFAECGDGTLNTTAGEQCDDGNVVPGDGCDANCQSELCGNGTLDPGEECDDGNTVSGDGCDANCRNEADSCANATAIAGEGPFDFDNTTATRDGPPHANCLFAIEDQMDSDVWACWTSPCTATVFVDTCRQTAIDTEIAVYEGCGCPATDGRLAACNDDVCDECAACGYQSVVAFEAISGQSYLIRMGTFPGAPGGVGTMTIRCGAANCPGVGDCFSANGTPGCDDEECCELTCSVDPFCCYVAWDDQCASRASFECNNPCGDGAGDCMSSNGTPGCDDVDCCNTVCEVDTICCADTWDDVCVCEAAGLCNGSFDACAAGSGNCSVDNSTPGCDDVECCNTVCAADPFCCCDTWDATCAEEAADMCSR